VHNAYVCYARPANTHTQGQNAQHERAMHLLLSLDTFQTQIAYGLPNLKILCNLERTDRFRTVHSSLIASHTYSHFYGILEGKHISHASSQMVAHKKIAILVHVDLHMKSQWLEFGMAVSAIWFDPAAVVKWLGTLTVGVKRYIFYQHRPPIVPAYYCGNDCFWLIFIGESCFHPANHT
jgi:hypothetical protein